MSPHSGLLLNREAEAAAVSRNEKILLSWVTKSTSSRSQQAKKKFRDQVYQDPRRLTSLSKQKSALCDNTLTHKRAVMSHWWARWSWQQVGSASMLLYRISSSSNTCTYMRSRSKRIHRKVEWINFDREIVAVPFRCFHSWNKIIFRPKSRVPKRCATRASRLFLFFFNYAGNNAL